MTQSKPLNIICAGECMLELRQAPRIEQKEAQYTSSFAGDVINFAVYLKRLGTCSSVQFLSATGNDALSEEMHRFLSGEDINSELVARSKDHTVGLYMIHTDDLGERTFSYWRSDSAARKMFELADKAVLSKAVDTADYFYFSGITLAILDQPSRDQLFALAEQCRRSGKIIIFDPNYRARLWQSRDQALTQIERAYQYCNILLSGREDEQLLWGESSTESTLERLANYNIDEIILTNGPDEVIGCDHGRRFQIQPVNADKVVDTTSAGDAFNAGYIAARHAGYSTEESVVKASGLASLVIGLPGAIIPKSRMVQ
jgi:2-dehydro-3-deoxygluconokinase